MCEGYDMPSSVIRKEEVYDSHEIGTDEPFGQVFVR